MTEAQKNENIEAVENEIKAINEQVQNLGIEDADEMAQEFIARLIVLKESGDWDEEQEEAIDKHISLMKLVHVMNERSKKEEREVVETSYTIFYDLINNDKVFGEEFETFEEILEVLEKFAVEYENGDLSDVLFMRNTIGDNEANVAITTRSIVKFSAYKVTKFSNGDYEAEIV